MKTERQRSKMILRKSEYLHIGIKKLKAYLIHDEECGYSQIRVELLSYRTKKTK